MRFSNRHPMVLIRAVTVLTFGLLLGVSSLTCPVAGKTVSATDADVRGSDGRYTAVAGVSLATMDILSEAQKLAALEAAQVDTVAAPEETEPEEAEEVVDYSENPDVILLAQLIEAESGSIDNINERAAVGLTVCHRCDMSQWPDTISGNIYKTNQYATPSASYSQASLDAAILAYTSWKEGTDDQILPEQYYSFFGNGSHNYFYDKSLQIYNMPGVPMPGDIYDQMTQIIPALRRSAEQEAEIAENSEPITESVEDDPTYPMDQSEDLTQSETTNSEITILENINEGNNHVVSQNVEDELVATPSDTSSEASEIPSDEGNDVTAEQEKKEKFDK